MGIQTTNHQESQTARLKIKNLSQQMKQNAINGVGMSSWEADVLVDQIENIYFNDDSLRGTQPGQLQYCCVSGKEGPGKPLINCEMITVLLTLYKHDDNQDLGTFTGKGRQAIIRQRRLCRICDEALSQGGLLTQEDLAQILMCDVKTIRRDVKKLKDREITVATRGQQKDIGPGITHRAIIVRKWLEGKEEREICIATKHSMKSVESYLMTFRKVVYLRREKKFNTHEIAVTVGISSRLVSEHLKLYEQYKAYGIADHRIKEINIIGGEFYRETGEKKDSQQSSKLKETWRLT